MYTADQYSLITACKQKNNQRCPEEEKKKSYSSQKHRLKQLYHTEFEKIFNNINSNMYREIKMKSKKKKKKQYPSNNSYVLYTQQIKFSFFPLNFTID